MRDVHLPHRIKKVWYILYVITVQIHILLFLVCCVTNMTNVYYRKGTTKGKVKQLRTLVMYNYTFLQGCLPEFCKSNSPSVPPLVVDAIWLTCSYRDKHKKMHKVINSTFPGETD